jgi:hypothetical protein
MPIKRDTIGRMRQSKIDWKDQEQVNAYNVEWRKLDLETRRAQARAGYHRRKDIPNPRKADCHPDRPYWANGLCKPCYMSKWTDENRAHVNRSRREVGNYGVYGLTRAEHDALVARQGGKCALCKNPFMPGSRYRSTRIDHVPGTRPKKVRGILCHGCNLFVGYLEKRRELLPAALAYLWPTEHS